VPEHHRFPHGERTDMPMRIVMYIAAADADRMDADADVLWPKRVRDVDGAQGKQPFAF
jgi:hypothetical protein